LCCPRSEAVMTVVVQIPPLGSGPRDGTGDEYRTWHHRSRRRQLANGLPRHLARRRLDRLFDRRFYRSLHPHRGGPRLQRRVSANLKGAAGVKTVSLGAAHRRTAPSNAARAVCTRAVKAGAALPAAAARATGPDCARLGLQPPFVAARPCILPSFASTLSHGEGIMLCGRPCEP
jgi:hypothetical protein